ncbi:MAG: hypothetical protein RXR41_01315 [Candidatus Marsarchaeota archaeon]
MSQEKFVVEVIPAPDGLKPTKEALDSLRSALSRKMLSKMQNEAVVCPVFSETIPFLNCMNCPNFIRRFKGKVYCRGENVKKPIRTRRTWASRPPYGAGTISPLGQ